MSLPIETENPLFGLYLYPAAKEIMEKQQDVSWTEMEIPVEKDIHTYRHTLTPEQLNLVTVTLQLFVETEQKVGDVWEQIASWFPHSEIDGMCTEIARMEKCVHAFFYQKMSDVLNIDPEDTARDQENIQVLKSKLQFLGDITSNASANKPLTLATVTLIEQVLLFSNFAMLKSFQSNGHNLIKNTITGVDFVVQDETLHGSAAAYLFQTMIDEDGRDGHNIDMVALEYDIRHLLDLVIAHEDSIIDYTFSAHAAINDITPGQLKTFIRSRANEALQILGMDPYCVLDRENPIAVWFYKDADSIKMHDFFVSGTSQYRRSWKFDSFSVLPFLKENHD